MDNFIPKLKNDLYCLIPDNLKLIAEDWLNASEHDDNQDLVSLWETELKRPLTLYEMKVASSLESLYQFEDSFYIIDELKAVKDNI